MTTNKQEESWEKSFLKLHYEPVHEYGPTCWCGPSYYKEEDGFTHLRHKEQRDKIKSFISSLLAKQKEEEADKWQSACQHYYEEGRKDATKELENKYENCPQCTGLREEYKEELTEMVEGMKLGEIGGTSLGIAHSKGYDEAIVDIITNIREKR